MNDPRASEPRGEACMHALLLAGGMGARLDQGRAKGLVRLAGIPLYLHALRALRSHPRVVSVVVVVPIDPEEQALFNASIEEEAVHSGAGVRVVVGGERRQDSGRAGLRALVDLGAEENAIVLVHDAARPFVSAALLDRLLEGMTRSFADLEQGRLPGLTRTEWADAPAGVVPGLPVRETLKLVYEDRVVLTTPRENLYAAQTPQAFRLGPLLDAHRRAEARGFLATDDASLLEWQGIPVRLVPGEVQNIKITYREDLELAERWLASVRPAP